MQKDSRLGIELRTSLLCSDLFEGERCLKKRPEWEIYRGSLYYFSTNKSSWTDSRRSCVGQKSDLVKIDSREEDLMEDDLEKFWIGLTDSKEEGKWLWVDGSPLNKSLSFWMPWEPDNLYKTDPAGEDCGGMGKKGGADDLICWFDQNCGLRRRSICEKSDEDGYYDDYDFDVDNSTEI
uniref:C-type lectin domain-containing protein n=1 Tax=Poecilia reticulata TaxID=8081 RepID=A0A3P9NQ51_POERE